MSLILQLDVQGQPVKWCTWQDAVTYHAKGLIAWEFGETENDRSVLGGDNRFTGQRSKIVTSSIIAVKGDVKHLRCIPALNNQKLFRRDHHMCAYCGKVMHVGKKLTRDHIVPRSKGGEDTWMNVVACCVNCNQRKADRTPEQAGMQLLFVPYVPSHAEHLILANRNVLADQMEFLMAFMPEDSRVKQELRQKYPQLVFA